MYTLPDNTFRQDFLIAERFGINAIIETAKIATKEWFDNPYMFAALVITLNHRLWDLHQTNPYVAEVYEQLYFNADNKSCEYTGEDADIYFALTD